MTQCPLTPLLARLEAVAPETAWGQSPKPAPLARFGPGDQVVLDVRDDLRRGQEPFGRIMGAITELRPSQVVLLRTPFEPLPLYHVLDRRGVAHWTERRAADDWVVWFWREADVRAAETLDVRGLEPPDPMVRARALIPSTGEAGS